MKTKIKKKYKAFTLVELLVVIAIIGLLASIILVSVRKTNSKGRDSRRLEDIRTISTAMQLYMTSASSNPPITDGYVGCDTSLNALNPYISNLPKDPLVGCADLTSGYTYYYKNTNVVGGPCYSDNNSGTYCVRFLTEDDTSLGPAGYYCLTSTGFHKAGSLPGERGGDNCLQQ